MKKISNQTYYNDAQVVCACGNTFTTGSTKKTIQVDICSKCHPFYTGEMKYVDTQGRVEKFISKRDLATKSKRSPKKDRRREESATNQQKTLKEMLQKAK